MPVLTLVVLIFFEPSYMGRLISRLRPPRAVQKHSRVLIFGAPFLSSSCQNSGLGKACFPFCKYAFEKATKDLRQEVPT
ncbi:hypothetical protein B0H12DRAFT_1099953 [Mycena haematopus]|nr:hypothetical protein B0H12DRAFT_1099953 [Mycena haematopus]